MMPPDPELGVATKILLVWSPAVGQHDRLEIPSVPTAGQLAHDNMPQLMTHHWHAMQAEDRVSRV